MDMKRTVFFFTLSLAAMLAHAQLTLEECQRRAQDNYPLVRQYGLIEKARGYDLSNAGKGYLPQFSLSGKATYQSDITRLPVEIPNLDIKTAPKDQYLFQLFVQQQDAEKELVHPVSQGIHVYMLFFQFHFRGGTRQPFSGTYIPTIPEGHTAIQG